MASRFSCRRRHRFRTGNAEALAGRHPVSGAVGQSPGRRRVLGQRQALSAEPGRSRDPARCQWPADSRPVAVRFRLASDARCTPTNRPPRSPAAWNSGSIRNGWRSFPFAHTIHMTHRLVGRRSRSPHRDRESLQRSRCRWSSVFIPGIRSLKRRATSGRCACRCASTTCFRRS